jgi:hypothetical protein
LGALTAFFGVFVVFLLVFYFYFNFLARDAEHGEREGDPKPRYGAGLADGWIERLTMDDSMQV